MPSSGTTTGSSGCWRAKASSCDARLAPRSTAAIAASMRLLVGLATARFWLQQLQVAADDLQHIVEVVGDAAGQLADRFELLRLVQGRLAQLQFPGTLQQLFLAGLERRIGFVALGTGAVGLRMVAHARHQFGAGSAT